MTGSTYDTGRAPIPMRRPNLFLSAYWPEAEHVALWRTRNPFALRAAALTHDACEIRIVIQFLGDRVGAAQDCVPNVPDEIPPGLGPLVAGILGALETPLQTRFESKVINFESETWHDTDTARLMIPDGGAVPPGGVRDVEASVMTEPAIFPRLSNHQLLGFVDHPEIEYYRCPWAG